jgi:hypothetical protein
VHSPCVTLAASDFGFDQTCERQNGKSLKLATAFDYRASSTYP